jgi:beta-xylosidase
VSEYKVTRIGMKNRSTFQLDHSGRSTKSLAHKGVRWVEGAVIYKHTGSHYLYLFLKDFGVAL